MLVTPRRRPAARPEVGGGEVAGSGYLTTAPQGREGDGAGSGWRAADLSLPRGLRDPGRVRELAELDDPAAPDTVQPGERGRHRPARGPVRPAVLAHGHHDLPGVHP